ncbi:MAG: hypothetical protein ACFB15_19925 [Cyclobacteriaceae bacterium]
MLETNVTSNGIDTPHTFESEDSDSQKINRRLLYYANHPQFIEHRIGQLDRETSVEQLIDKSAASLSLGGILLALLSNRRWLIFSVLTSLLFFLKSQVRDAGLLDLLREQGYRTKDEIALEKQMLQALRGDFDTIGIANQTPEERVSQIVRSLT